MRKLLLDIFTSVLGFVLILGNIAVINAKESGDYEFTLEEITVTAQKREENQQKVSIAMEVVSGEELKETGKNRIDDILSDISNVLINTAPDGLRVSVRGMSNDGAIDNNLQSSKPTVAVNKDGIYTIRNTGNANLFDIERVEVLFGPQSTLYASASPGGIVNIVTSEPKLDKYEGFASLEYGNYSLLKTEGGVNAPMGDKMALRLAFSTTVHDGYLSNGADDEDAKAGRIKYLFQPTDKLSIVTVGEISKSSAQGFSGAKKFNNQDDDYYTDGTPLKDPWTAAENAAVLPTDQEEKRLSAHIEWDLGYIGDLTVIPSMTKFTNYKSGVELTMTGPSGETEVDHTLDGFTDEKGLEARLVSSEDFPFKWILGLNYYKSYEEQHSYYYEQNDDDPDVIDSNRINTAKQKTKAIFGNITYPFTNLFRINAGIRMTWDKLINTGSSWDSSLNPDDPYVLTSTGNPSIVEYNEPDYKLGFEYDLSDNSMLFMDWSTSYRVNGKNQDKVIPPEKLKAYTVGAKNRFFGNKLQANVSAYYYDYENFFTIGDPVNTIDDLNENGRVDPGETEQINDLGQLTYGDARIYGFDIQTSTIITQKDKLNLSISYVNKKFKDIIFDYEDITNWLGLEDMSYNDYEMANAPKWTLKLNYEHNFNLPNGGTLTPKLETTFQSSYLITWQADNISLEEDDEGNYYYLKESRGDVRIQEAYHVEDLSILYANPDGKWTLNLYVNNLENYAKKVSLIGQQSGGELRLASPRTFGAVVSVRW